MNYLNLRMELPVVLHDLLIAGTTITKPFLCFPLLCENALFKFPVLRDRRGCFPAIRTACYLIKGFYCAAQLHHLTSE